MRRTENPVFVYILQQGVLMQTTVAGHAPSLLPKGKKWNLIWHDEFDGTELDLS